MPKTASRISAMLEVNAWMHLEASSTFRNKGMFGLSDLAFAIPWD